jgi:hypothetical protein
MKSLMHLLILVISLASCSNETAESPEREHFRQVLRHLNWENERILGRSDPAICGFALEQDQSSKYETPHWEDDPTYRKYVDEAKRRGFSAHSCAAMFGWQSAQSKHVQNRVGDVEHRLTKLKTLYDEGLIAQPKYDEIRQQILEAH